LIFFTGEYFSKCLDEKQSAMLSPIIESVLHLDLSSTSERCHVPMMIAPHSHSVWWSREDQ
jgi:5-hydroxyisourate hydrolase-like protein (transthyretin family)